ncbi:MAG: M20/M25/M40 family metallo-hydrolase [Planctomycetota bacterium]|nr:M20/M25/M40 family metallo-hydrolase [Planctomycetota bacterium]
MMKGTNAGGAVFGFYRLGFLLAAVLTVAADETPLHEVSGARALETVKILSSDEFGGRKSGLASGRNAEAWMAAQVEKMGLEPGYGSSFFHDFKANVTNDKGPALFLAKGGEAKPRTGKYLDDFVSLLYSGFGTVEAPVVFAGYGIREPKKGRNDYEGLDVKGKIVMALRGKPPDSLFDDERQIGYKSSTAADLGAAGFLLVEGDAARPGTIQEKFHREKLPALWIGRKAADDLFARAKKENLAAQVEALKKGESRSFELEGVTVAMQAQTVLIKDAAVRNVVAKWPGETDECVVLGAHLDHVGTDAVGNVYNGADDNASGSSMLLEVARAVAARGKKHKRTLIFVWFAGEEQGLLGSWAFVKAPPIPLKSIAVMINTDMVGQGKPIMAVGGREVYPQDAKFLGEFKVEGFKEKHFAAQPNSDHYPFMHNGVPAFFVHTEGPHPNYHQPGDDWQKIKPELLETSGRFLLTLAERAANSEHPHCRPARRGGYLWHRARVVDLHAADQSDRALGTDVSVRWLDGTAEEIVRTIEVHKATKKKGKGKARGLAAARRRARRAQTEPQVLFAVRDHIEEAVAAGARVVAWKDGIDLAALYAKYPFVLSIEDATPAMLTFPGPLLVNESQASSMKSRKAPWLIVHAIDEEGSTPAKTAARIIELRKKHGGNHVLVVPDKRNSPTFSAVMVQTLLDAGLDERQIRQVLGGTFANALRFARKKSG